MSPKLTSSQAQRFNPSQLQSDFVQVRMEELSFELIGKLIGREQLIFFLTSSSPSTRKHDRRA